MTMQKLTVGWEETAKQCLAAIGRGTNLIVTGPRYSGRTSLLELVATQLQEDGWRTLTITGTAKLKAFPLGHLQASLPTSRQMSARVAIAQVAQELREVLDNRPMVVIVDNIDYLDDASWGLLQTTTAAQGVPILASRVRAAPNDWSQGFGSEIRLTPWRLPYVEFALATRLQVTLRSDTMSRVFSKSGGLVGLACAVTEAAILTGTIRQDENDIWYSPGELYSPAMMPLVEAYLSQLDEEDRAILETVALVGFTDLDIVTQIAPVEALARLEQRGLLTVTHSEGQHLVSVFPPLIADAVQMHLPFTRRLSLTKNLPEGFDEKKLAVQNPPVSSSRNPATAATGVRIFHERLKARVAAARLNWSADPGLANTIKYIVAMMPTPAEHATIDQLFATTDPTDGSPHDRIRFAKMQAQWMAVYRQDLPGALELLAVRREPDNPYSRLLEVMGLQLETMLRAVPEDFASRLELDESLPQEVIDETLEAQVFVLLTLGRIADARATLARISREWMGRVDTSAHWLHGMVLLAEGQFEEIQQWAREGMEVAFRDLHYDAFFDHGYLMILSSVFHGDYGEVSKVAAELFGVGEPSVLRPNTHLALLTLSLMIAVRRGAVGIAERVLASVNSLPMSIGPCLAQSRAMAMAQFDAFNGHMNRAIDGVWQEGERSWERGYRFVACQQFLMSVEMKAVPARLERLREAMSQVDGEFLASFYAFIQAREARDPNRLIELAPRLVAAGRPSVGAVALELAGEIARSRDQRDLVEQADLLMGELFPNLKDSPMEARRFRNAIVSLSKRELEIARMIAEGLSNPDIATRLVISVRTVESHVNRILRKTETSSRQELISLMNDDEGKSRYFSVLDE